MKTTDMRSLPREARHERRVQVIRLRAAGYTYEAIAEQTGLSRTGVFDICKRHASGGAKALRDVVGGRKSGEGRRLTGEQEAEVRRLICDKTPDQLKMPYALWTRGAVTELIEHRFGIRHPASGIRHPSQPRVIARCAGFGLGTWCRPQAMAAARARGYESPGRLGSSR